MKFDLVIINPSVILGPSLTTSVNESHKFNQQVLNGDFNAGYFNISFGLVDVRDVARAHIRGIDYKQKPGSVSRFICANKTVHFEEIVEIISDEFPEYAKRLPKRNLPDWLVRVVALFQPSGVRDFIQNNLGLVPALSNQKMLAEFQGMELRNVRATIVDTCKWLIDAGHVKPNAKK